VSDDTPPSDSASTSEATAKPEGQPVQPGATAPAEAESEEPVGKGAAGSTAMAPEEAVEERPEVAKTPKVSEPDDDEPAIRVDPFFGAAQFFSVRGFLAATSLFFLTLLVCLMAIDLVWALAIALLFTIAISTGHLVFYTKDRHIRERVYFAVVALGAFFGGALVLDLQLTHPYFIRLRKFHADTVTLKQELAGDIRFVKVVVETKLMKTAVADLSGTVQKSDDLKALRTQVEETGFWIGEFEVTVASDQPQPDSGTKPDADSS
jgi:hypothetical protein